MVSGKADTVAAIREELQRLRAEQDLLSQRTERLLKQLTLPGTGQPSHSDAHNLRGSVTYLGDIVSPTGETWDSAVDHP